MEFINEYKIMKKLFFLVVPYLIAANVSAQSNSEIISQIRQVYYSVNKQVEYIKEISINIEGESTESGELSLFYSDGNIVKSKLMNYGEMGKRSTELYYLDGVLVFLYDVIFNYDKPIYLGDITITSKDENRYYIWGGKLVKYISPEKAETWNELIPNLKEKQAFIDDTKNFVSKASNNRLLADIPVYHGQSIDKLIEQEKKIEEKISEITKGNKDVMAAPLATLAKLKKEDEWTYTIYGELPWGDGLNSTYLVFDLLKDNIYIYSNMDGEEAIYGSDKNYPAAFKKWIEAQIN